MHVVINHPGRVLPTLPIHFSSYPLALVSQTPHLPRMVRRLLEVAHHEYEKSK